MSALPLKRRRDDNGGVSGVIYEKFFVIRMAVGQAIIV
jgi:hypothetical protein